MAGDQCLCIFQANLCSVTVILGLGWLCGFLVLCRIGFCIGVCCFCFVENCPDQNPRLRNWDPGQDSAKHVVIREGDMFRLTSDATMDSIVIQDGGR